ncbi:MAG TPA: flagellar hook-length control protein FliK [bacterium]|nr:flagellar hook-length control protein FliK [bacterium]
MSFSDLQVNAFQNQEGQSSRISIDMESFKMSATFIQAESKGRPLVLPQGMTALNDSNISEDLTQKLQQALAAVQDQQGPMPSNQSNSFNQVLKPETLANFKELVQLLMQSGVTRAALTSFMNRNQENANQNPNNPSAPLGERGQVLAPKTPSEILLLPVEGAPNVSSTPTFEVSRNLASQLNQISSQLTEGNVAVVPASNGDLSPQTSLRSETTVQSSSASQGEVPPTTAFGPVGVLSSALEPNPEMVGPIHPSAQSVGNAPFMRPAGNVQTHQEIQDKVIQNDNVSKLNTASLHATQGSLTFGDLHPFSSQVYTLNQVTGSQAATQLNSPIPAVLSGSPSVPQNTPEVPPVEVALRTQTIKAEVTAALDLGRSTSRSANGNTPALQVGGEISRSSTQSVLPIEVLNNPTLPEPTATNTGLNETKIPAVAASDLSPNSISIPTSASQADLFKGNLQTTVPNDHGVTDTSRPGTLPHTVPAPALIPAPGPAYQGQVAQSQGMIPPVPTSTTPLVPFTATAGEGLKAELQPQMLQGTLNAGRTVPVGSFQPDQTIKVQAPEGVTPIVSVTGTDSSNQVLSATDKSDPKDTTSLDIATLLASTGSGVSRPEDSLKFAQNMNNLSNNPRFSMDQNQIYDLVSAQLTTQLVQARNVSRLNFQLVPESLGKVTVQIALVDQSLSARIFVSNPEVREAVQNHLVDLRASLSQAGLQIDQLQVQVQGGGANLLGQYYQYQQEGSSYRSPIYEAAVGQGGPENLENTGVLASSGRSLTLVDLLA